MVHLRSGRAGCVAVFCGAMAASASSNWSCWKIRTGYSTSHPSPSGDHEWIHVILTSAMMVVGVTTMPGLGSGWPA